MEEHYHPADKSVKYSSSTSIHYLELQNHVLWFFSPFFSSISAKDCKAVIALL
jgi:hypothetical protein